MLHWLLAAAGCFLGLLYIVVVVTDFVFGAKLSPSFLFLKRIFYRKERKKLHLRWKNLFQCVAESSCAGSVELGCLLRMCLDIEYRLMDLGEPYEDSLSNKAYEAWMKSMARVKNEV